MNSILGIYVPAEKMLEILNLLSINSELKGGKIVSLVPSYREDIIGVNDIAEEIIRMYGYDHIEDYKLPLRGGRSREVMTTDRVKNLLVGEGINEIVTYSFTTAKSFDYLNLSKENPLRKAIKLKNALGEDFSVMRTTLIHSMLSTIASNAAKGNKEGRLFECARVYIPKDLPLKELPVEKEMLCLGIFGGSENYLTLKGIIEKIYDIASVSVKYVRAKEEFLHPGISAYIMKGEENIGVLGEVHPDVLENYDLKVKAYVAEISLKAVIDNFIRIKPFIAIPKYPSIERDLALVMDEKTEIGGVMDFIASFNPLIKSVKLFDIYRGNQILENKKSAALTVEMRDPERTLKIEETVPVIDNHLKALETKFTAKLRE
jgi:phenylalanyl-tRNA synthetase beta chain